MKALNILLVDDDELTNELNQLIISESVGKNNTINTKAFTSGNDALTYIDNLKPSDINFPNLIFLDINMPVMDGWGFLKEFGKRKLNRGVILMLSSSIWNEDIKRAKRHELVKDFIAKPLSFQSIPKILDEFIYEASIK